MVLDADFSIWEERQEDLFKVIIHREFMGCLGYLLCETLPVEEQGPNSLSRPGLPLGPSLGASSADTQASIQ